MTDVKQPKGWWMPSNATKAHYFNNDRTSLCGSWAFWGRLEDQFEDSGHDHRQNCKACMRKREALARANES